MSYHLFLDDIRDPNWVHWMKLPIPAQAWVVVRSFDEFVAAIKTTGMPEFISFDHDLDAEGEIALAPTGMDCAKWLVDFCLDNGAILTSFAVHSMNPAGKVNIEGLLNGFKRHQSTPTGRPHANM
jgi:hypothetical protein